jgi:protein-disulfide isomerase
MKSFFRLALTCALCLTVIQPSLGGQQDKKGGKGEAQDDTAALKRQVQDLQQGQQQILQELKELRKLIEAGANTQAAGRPDQTVSLNVYGEPFKGSDSARVAMIEYSDFECPFCGEYARQLYPRILESYVKTGKVRYYFRDLPLPIHPNAMRSALAARCAGEQGKFWEMHDSLFADQSALSEKDILRRAVALGLDQSKFSECFSANKYADSIRKSRSGAERLSITGTPAFAFGLVEANGEVVKVSQMVLGAQSYEEFKAVLDELLSSQPQSK